MLFIIRMRSKERQRQREHELNMNKINDLLAEAKRTSLKILAGREKDFKAAAIDLAVTNICIQSLLEREKKESIFEARV